MEEIIVDNFAGGGGASAGIELATGQSAGMVYGDPDHHHGGTGTDNGGVRRDRCDRERRRGNIKGLQNPGNLPQEGFPVRLRRLREEKRVSRAIVSELCGLDRDAVRNYERGERVPTMDALVALADYFEVSMDYLTGRTKFR